jgi:putative lipoprotein
VLSFLVVGFCGPSRAFPADHDPWFGRDKALHFSLSAVISMGGYGVTSVATEDRLWRFLIGGGAALGAGFGKEALDATGSGDASLRDLTWDVVGTTTGLGLAFLIDWLTSRPAGPLSPDRGRIP